MQILNINQETIIKAQALFEAQVPRFALFRFPLRTFHSVLSTSHYEIIQFYYHTSIIIHIFEP